VVKSKQVWKPLTRQESLLRAKGLCEPVGDCEEG